MSCIVWPRSGNVGPDVRQFSNAINYSISYDMKQCPTKMPAELCQDQRNYALLQLLQHSARRFHQHLDPLELEKENDFGFDYRYAIDNFDTAVNNLKTQPSTKTLQGILFLNSYVTRFDMWLRVLQDEGADLDSYYLSQFNKSYKNYKAIVGARCWLQNTIRIANSWQQLMHEYSSKKSQQLQPLPILQPLNAGMNLRCKSR